MLSNQYLMFNNIRSRVDSQNSRFIFLYLTVNTFLEFDTQYLKLDVGYLIFKNLIFNDEYLVLEIQTEMFSVQNLTSNNRYLALNI